LFRRRRVVLALAGRTGQGGDDRILGADAGMDGIARGGCVALGDEVVLCGGEVLLGLLQEGLGVIELLGTGRGVESRGTPDTLDASLSCAT